MPDFYHFQQHEKKREGLLKLREQFEADKARIAKMRSVPPALQQPTPCNLQGPPAFWCSPLRSPSARHRSASFGRIERLGPLNQQNNKLVLI